MGRSARLLCTTHQERFERFRRERMRERKLAQFNASETSKKERTVEFKNNLRSKFVAAAKKYMGVPYAAKYHGPESPHYNAELYLDCCGLVRRAVQDLQQEFGFKIGRWNQNYQVRSTRLCIHVRHWDWKGQHVCMCVCVRASHSLIPSPKASASKSSSPGTWCSLKESTRSQTQW